MVSTSKLASESVDESSDHKAVKPQGIVENQRRPRELAGEDQVEIPGDLRPGSLKHKLQQLEGMFHFQNTIYRLRNSLKTVGKKF